jgi:hypothetical protein
VHRSVGEQLEDRGSHVTAPAASAATRPSAPATAGSTGSEATGSEAAGSEAEATTWAEAGAAETRAEAEAGVFAAVFADVVAEVATGLLALFVQHAAVTGAEPETWAARERAFVESFIEWGVHVCCPFRRETPNALPIR